MSPGLVALYLALALLVLAGWTGLRTGKRESNPRSASRSRPCALYHIPGSGGRALRIGISVDPEARERQYARTAWWWSQRTGPLTVRQWYPSEAAAHRAEIPAIGREAPPYNVQHNFGRHHASPVLARPAPSHSAGRPLRPGRLGDVRGLRAGRQPARQGSRQAC